MSKPAINLSTSDDLVKPYYVYVHKRATDGRVFYVGKGKGNRAWSKHNRNKWWSDVVSRHGFTVEIVKRFGNEKEAYSFEGEMVVKYGRKNLCNLSDGGSGLSNPYPIKNVMPLSDIDSDRPNRVNFSRTIFDFYHSGGEVFSGTYLEFARAFKFSDGDVLGLVKGYMKALRGWRVIDT